MFVLAENLRIPARFKGRSEVSTTPRASFLLTQASRWLAMLQAVPLSVDTYPEKYRGHLTLSVFRCSGLDNFRQCSTH